MRVAHPRGWSATATPTSSCTPSPTRCSGRPGSGDIGDAYPDTDPRYKDADSPLFVAETAGAAEPNGWRVVNLDVTIFAQEPKLGPVKGRDPRQRWRRLLGLPPTRST